MLPQLGVGAWIPSPRKSSAASISTTWPTPRLADPAVVPGDEADRRPDREREPDREEADPERHLGPVDEPRERVASELVGPQPVLAAGRGERVAEVLGHRALVRDEPRDQRGGQ